MNAIKLENLRTIKVEEFDNIYILISEVEKFAMIAKIDILMIDKDYDENTIQLFKDNLNLAYKIINK